MAAIYSNGSNRWNILGFNFTERDALSSVYKISMGVYHALVDFVISNPAVFLFFVLYTSLGFCYV